jgi:hypothetical protein
MDRTYFEPLDIPRLARIACVSEAHFIRTFRATFGGTPHRYLQRRRVERAMFLLRESGRSLTEVCPDVIFGQIRNVAHYRGRLVTLSYYSLLCDPASVAATQALNAPIIAATQILLMQVGSPAD